MKYIDVPCDDLCQNMYNEFYGYYMLIIFFLLINVDL